MKPVYLDKTYNPNQPRVPAGSPEGGEFGSGGGAQTELFNGRGRVSDPGNKPHPVGESAARFNAKTEGGFLLLPNGEAKPIGKGDKHSLEFSPAERVAVRGQVLTHNHPNGTGTFSGSDLYLASFQGLKETRVICKESDGNYLYRAWPGPKGWPSPDTLYDAYQRNFDHYLKWRNIDHPSFAKVNHSIVRFISKPGTFHPQFPDDVVNPGFNYTRTKIK